MASGFGMKGGPGRCYSFWVDFSKCVQRSDEPVKDCGPYREDYFECLHHKKEYERMAMINRELKKQGGVPPPEDDAPTTTTTTTTT